MDLLATCVPLTPASVLRSLAGVVDAPRDVNELPEVTVHTSAGHVLTGRLVRLGADRGHDVVVLACSDAPTERPDRLAYVEVTQVVAVAVHAPERVRDVLSAGALPSADAGEPVARLTLRRDFPASAEFPLVLDWAAIPESASALANLQRLLGALRQAVHVVSADAVGRHAWSRVSALRVEHRPGITLTIQPQVDGVQVSVDLTAALPRKLVERVTAQLSAALL